LKVADPKIRSSRSKKRSGRLKLRRLPIPIDEGRQLQSKNRQQPIKNAAADSRKRGSLLSTKGDSCDRNSSSCRLKRQQQKIEKEAASDRNGGCGQSKKRLRWIKKEAAANRETGCGKSKRLRPIDKDAAANRKTDSGRSKNRLWPIEE